METIVLIPARMNSTRLPGKVMEEINGVPMVIHVAERAIAADIGPVVVVCDHPRVLNECASRKIQYVMTDPEDFKSGTDRIAHALGRLDPNNQYDLIVNVQADVPTINPKHIRALAELMNIGTCDMATLCAIDHSLSRVQNPHVVKVMGSPMPLHPHIVRALYFTRAMPFGQGENYHHIGTYAYERSALERLFRLPRSPLERREGLEQLRALENDMRIYARIVNEIPIGVDTREDLDRVRESLKTTA